jgi:hypothetical protein
MILQDEGWTVEQAQEETGRIEEVEEEVPQDFAPGQDD